MERKVSWRIVWSAKIVPLRVRAETAILASLARSLRLRMAKEIRGSARSKVPLSERDSGRPSGIKMRLRAIARIKRMSGKVKGESGRASDLVLII